LLLFDFIKLSLSTLLVCGFAFTFFAAEDLWEITTISIQVKVVIKEESVSSIIPDE